MIQKVTCMRCVDCPGTEERNQLDLWRIERVKFTRG